MTASGTLSYRSERSRQRRTGAAPGTFLAALLIGAVGGVALLRGPFAAVLVLCAVCTGCGIILFFRALPRIFLGSLALLLLGYASMGKSFAYLGASPLFVGELALALGLIAAVASGSIFSVIRSPVTILILAFSLWGVIRTVPYLGLYGMDAARDAVLWGYSAFSLSVAACIVNTRRTASVAQQYSRWITPLAAWFAPALMLTRLLDAPLSMPGTEVPLFSLKASDAGSHLAGAAAFVLVGLHRGSNGGQRAGVRTPYVFWAFWLIAFACVTAMNRAGFLGVAAALFMLATLQPITIGRRVAVAVVVVTLGAGALLATAVSLENTSSTAEGTLERGYSAHQVLENILSIVGLESQPASNLSDTKEWRLTWWSTIVDYTLFGPYFWSGKGFGINLADDDGFQVSAEDETPLRSPHNGHLTILARMGVPGFLLWVLLQLAFGLSLLCAFLRACQAGAVWWARVDLWILSYWLAFVVIATFDVFLEGPMAGIWFWSLIGFGIGAVQLQRSELKHMRPGWGAK